MKYVTFGKTGLKVSRLGFGGMRFPYAGGRVDRAETLKILNLAFDRGVNYFDTAPIYCDGLSEEILGEFIADKRDRVILSTKDGETGTKGFIDSFERSFGRLKTDCVDVFHFWHLNGPDFKKVTAAKGLLEFAYRMKKEGRVRHFAFSFHDENPANAKDIIDSGLFESMLISFNMINRVNGEWLQYADAKGLGTAIMNPVAGGAIVADNPKIKAYEGTSNARVALKYAFSLPFIDIVLSGMSSAAQVIENCETACGDYELTADEKKVYENICTVYDSLLRLYCTGCKYCAGCPEGVDIPQIFKIYNDAKVTWGGWAEAKRQYAKLKVKADKCIECGACMGKCTQKLDIVKLLKECDKSLL